jgi:hypothetical protein
LLNGHNDLPDFEPRGEPAQEPSIKSTIDRFAIPIMILIVGVPFAVYKILEQLGAPLETRKLGSVICVIIGMGVIKFGDLAARFWAQYKAESAERDRRIERGWRRHEKKVQRLREKIEEGELVIGADGEIVSADEVQKERKAK